MKVKMTLLAAVLIWVAATLPAQGADESALKTQKEKMSYIIGMDVANNIHKQSIDMDSKAFLKGFHDALEKRKPLLNEQEIKDITTAFQKEMTEKHQNMMQQTGEKNKIEGKAFLAENKKKEGVKTLPSGLQYKVIKEGSGKTPKLTDKVTTNYKGALIDGTEFDSSYKRGRPATFPVNGVIKGWTEALQLMKTGAKWQLFIPSDLAYGERGAGPQIGPNAVLVFDLELISIQ